MSQRDYAWLWLGATKSVVGGGGGATAGGGNVLLKAPAHLLDGPEHLTPTDGTRLDATVDQHGLLPKLSGVSTDALLGDGTWGGIVASGSLPRPEDYGAAGDGSTDDSTAVGDWLDDYNAGNIPILYAPSQYLTGGGYTISKSGLFIGVGMGAYDGSDPVSAFFCPSGTADLFTVTAKQLLFRDLGLFNTDGGTPSAGSLIKVDGSFIGQKVDLDSIVLKGAYVNLNRLVGAQWVNRNVWNWGAVLYGEHIENTVNQDAGDAAIIGCFYYADTHNATAAIHQTGAGGLKVLGTKINGHGGAAYVDGIYASGSGTSILVVSGNSIENVSGDAIEVTGGWDFVSITGNEVALYSNNTGRAVKLNGTQGAVIDGGVFKTDGTARAAVELVGTDEVWLGEYALVGFNARFTSSGGATNTHDQGVSLGDHTHAATGTGSTGGGATLQPGTFDFPAATSPAQTAEGRAVWDSDDDVLTVGDGSARKTFGYLGSTTPIVASGAGSAGSGSEVSRATHVHPTEGATGAAHYLVIASSHSTPLVFGDIVQSSDQDDFVYTS